MTTAEVLEIVKSRGLRIELRDGRPVLIRPPGHCPVTDALMAVLARHRPKIVEALASKDNKA